MGFNSGFKGLKYTAFGWHTVHRKFCSNQSTGWKHGEGITHTFTARSSHKPTFYRFFFFSENVSRSRWPRGLTRGSASSVLLALRVRIPPGAWMSVCFECCVLSGRGLCVGLITRPEESYKLWCFWMLWCSLENEKAQAHWGGVAPRGGE